MFAQYLGFPAPDLRMPCLKEKRDTSYRLPFSARKLGMGVLAGCRVGTGPEKRVTRLGQECLSRQATGCPSLLPLLRKGK